MVNKSVLKQIEKYLKNIVVPKFPDIMDIEVKPKFEDDGETINFLEFELLMDGTEYDIEMDIIDAISDMFVYLSISDISFGFSFKTE